MGIKIEPNVGDKIICPICKDSNTIIKDQDLLEWKILKCDKCGLFKISIEAENALACKLTDKDPARKKKIANIRGFFGENKEPYYITEDNIDNLLSAGSRSVVRRAELLLVYLSTLEDTIGSVINYNYSDNESKHLRTTWSYDNGEILYLLEKYLGKEKYIEFPSNQSVTKLKITPKGYTHIESLMKSNQNSNTVFCAMSFEPETLKFYASAISPAIEEAGYEPKIVSQALFNEGIVDKILSMIRTSKFIIADLTDNKHGVYLEAGFAMGLGLPVIFTCKKEYFDKEKPHFDVRHFNLLLWKDANDLKEKLRDRITGTIDLAGKVK